MADPVSILSPSHEIIGPRLRLRDIRLEDAHETYAGWMNDPEVVRYTESRSVHHSPETLHDFIKHVTESQRDLLLAIVLKDEDRHIGNIKLGDIDIRRGIGVIGIIIGDKNCWGRGYASESIGLLANYAFETIGLHKLTAGIYAANEASIRAFNRAGFRKEGVLKDRCVHDGKRTDVLRFMRMQKDKSEK